MNIWQPSPQAEAVKAMLRAYLDYTIPLYYDGSNGAWGMAQWMNGREKGYVISGWSYFEIDRQLNIAFFEHRSSDDLCAIKWFQRTRNPPTIDTAEFGDGPDAPYKDGKDNVSFSVGYGKIDQMTNWIITQFDAEHEYLESLAEGTQDE